VEKARQFQFDFVVEREGKRVASFSHVWDRYTGDYRLTGTEKTGAPYVVYFNVIYCLSFTLNKNKKSSPSYGKSQR
jgi:hypothetical protein